jgi:hypothetical protein
VGVGTGHPTNRKSRRQTGDGWCFDLANEKQKPVIANSPWKIQKHILIWNFKTRQGVFLISCFFPHDRDHSLSRKEGIEETNMERSMPLHRDLYRHHVSVSGNRYFVTFAILPSPLAS